MEETIYYATVTQEEDTTPINSYPVTVFLSTNRLDRIREVADVVRQLGNRLGRYDCYIDVAIGSVFIQDDVLNPTDSELEDDRVVWTVSEDHVRSPDVRTGMLCVEYYADGTVRGAYVETEGGYRHYLYPEVLPSLLHL